MKRTAIYSSSLVLVSVITAVYLGVQNFFLNGDLKRLEAVKTADQTERKAISERASQLIDAFRVKLEPGTRQILVQSMTEAVISQLPTHEAREAYLLVLGIESRFGTVTNKSSAGAVGMAQIMPKLGRALAENCGLGAVSEKDLERDLVSLHVGACHFRVLYEQFGGNTALAQAAYNAGVGRVTSDRQLPEETARYVAKAAITGGSK